MWQAFTRNGWTNFILVYIGIGTVDFFTWTWRRISILRSSSWDLRLIVVARNNGPPSLLYSGYQGQSVRGVTLTTHLHLAPRLKKEYSYTSTPPLGLHGLFLGELLKKAGLDLELPRRESTRTAQLHRRPFCVLRFTQQWTQDKDILSSLIFLFWIVLGPFNQGLTMGCKCDKNEKKQEIARNSGKIL